VLEEPGAELAVGSVEEALKALVSDIGPRRGWLRAEPQVRKLEVVTGTILAVALTRTYTMATSRLF